MISKTLTVNNPEGLHMRPAGVIAKEMGKFACDITIVFGEKRINAKSLIKHHFSMYQNRCRSNI